MFAAVSKSVLFREGDGSGAVFIHGSRTGLGETQFICKFTQVYCFLRCGTESDYFAFGGVKCYQGGSRGTPTDCCVVEQKHVSDAAFAIGFDICKTGVGVAVYLPGKMGLLAGMGAPLKWSTDAAFEVPKYLFSNAQMGWAGLCHVP